MTAPPHSGPDPLAALPLLTEAGVSVYWQPLDGRLAWVADVDSRQVWLSRAIPKDSVLRYLVAALQALDDGADDADAEPGVPAPRLIHSADRIERRSRRKPPELHVVVDEA